MTPARGNHSRHALSTTELVQRIKSQYPNEDAGSTYGRFVSARNLKPEIDAKEYGKIFNSVGANAHVKTESVGFSPTHTDEVTGRKVQVSPTGNGHDILFENGSTGHDPGELADRYKPIAQGEGSGTKPPPPPTDANAPTLDAPKPTGVFNDPAVKAAWSKLKGGFTGEDPFRKTMGSGLGGASDFFERASDLAVAVVKAGARSFAHFAAEFNANLTGKDKADFNDGDTARRLYDHAYGHPDNQEFSGERTPPDAHDSGDNPSESPKIVGTKNALSAAERERLGMDERETPQTRSLPEMYEAGKKAHAADPSATETLLNAMRANPERMLDTVTEHGLMLNHLVDRANTADRLLDRIHAAEARGDTTAEANARTDLALHLATTKEIISLNERTGTATARSLAARNAMSKLDYSLTAMAARREEAMGRSLTPEEQKTVQREYSDIKEKLRVLEEAQGKHDAELAEAHSQRDHANLLREAAEKKLASRPTAPRSPSSKEYGAKNKLVTREAYEKAKAELLSSDTLYSGIPVDKMAKLVKMGVFHLEAGAHSLADFSAAMVADMGEKIKPHLADIYEAAQAAHSKAIQDDTLAKMKKRLAEPDTDLSALNPYLRKVALELINGGIKQREPLIDALHEKVKEILPDVSRTEVRDALSGYGKATGPTEDADKITLAHINQQSQKLAQIEHMQEQAKKPYEEREMPKETGPQRVPADQETRTLGKQYNEIKGEVPTPKSDNSRLTSALDSMKTRTRNAIDDMQAEIDLKERTVKGKRVPISDSELDALRKQLTDLRQVHEQIFGKRQLADAQRLDIATKAAERNLATWQERLDQAKKGGFPDNAGKRTLLSGPVLDAARAKVAEAKAQYEELKAQDPAQQAKENALANVAKRARLAEQTADILDRTARGDYSKRPQPPTRVWDSKTQAAQADLERARTVHRLGNEKAELARRAGWEKALDITGKVARFNVLAGVKILGKLADATGLQVVATPIKDIVGTLMNHTPGLNRLTAKAPREGGDFRFAHLAKAVVRASTQGFADAWKVLRDPTHQSNLKALYEKQHLSPGWLEFNGVMHSAIKSPLLRFGYEYSMERRSEFAAKHGVNPADPAITHTNGLLAYGDALRTLYQEKNPLSTGYQKFLSGLEAKNPDTGHSSVPGKVGATVGRVLMPVVTVGANISKQSFSHSPIGLLVGAGEAANAFRKGIDSISPAQADRVMRHLKEGSVGTAALILGIYGSSMLGGFWKRGDKRKPDDVAADSAKIGSLNIGERWLHHPLFIVMQAGAAYARSVAHGNPLDGPHAQGSRTQAALDAVVGMLGKNPFVAQGKSLADGMMQPGNALGKAASTLLVPQAAREVANELDKDHPFSQSEDTRGRVHRGFVQQIESGIPGLRQSLPLDQKKIDAKTHDELIEGLRDNPQQGLKDIDDALAAGKIDQRHYDAYTKEAKIDPTTLAIHRAPADKVAQGYERMPPTDQQKYAHEVSAKIIRSGLDHDAQAALFEKHGVPITDINGEPVDRETFDLYGRLEAAHDAHLVLAKKMKAAGSEPPEMDEGIMEAYSAMHKLLTGEELAPPP